MLGTRRTSHALRCSDARFGASHISGALGLKVAPMQDIEFGLLVRGFRARAAEILLRAETIRDVDIRLKLREIAASYERLAQRVEQAASYERLAQLVEQREPARQRRRRSIQAAALVRRGRVAPANGVTTLRS